MPRWVVRLAESAVAQAVVAEAAVAARDRQVPQASRPEPEERIETRAKAPMAVEQPASVEPEV